MSLLRRITDTLHDRYQSAGFGTELKARLLIRICGAGIIVLLLSSLAPRFLETGILKSTFNWSSLIIPAVGITILAGCIVLLRRGFFQPAGHIMTLGTMLVFWGILFTGADDIFRRFNTLIFLPAILATLPLTMRHYRFSIAAYSLGNLAMLALFAFTVGPAMKIPDAWLADFLTDATFSLVFLWIVIYNTHRINTTALEEAEADIAERKLQEAARTAEQAKLQAVIEQSIDGIVITDGNGRITAFNPAMARLTGIPAAEALGQPLLETMRFCLLPETDATAFLQERQTIVQDLLRHAGNDQAGRIWKGRLRARDGSIRTFQQSSFAVTSGDEQLAVAIVRDLTEQTELENQILRAQKLEAIGNLAGGLAHDMNNLITGMMGAGELLKMRLAGERLTQRKEIEQILGIINNASIRAADMVRRLLTVARKNTLALEPVRLAEIVRSVSALCENSFPKHVSLLVNMPAEGPVIMAEAARVEQALLNLCLNAQHAVSSMRDETSGMGGTITISLATITADAHFCSHHADAQLDGVYHCVKVQDDGVGIAPEVLPHIFEPFYTTKGDGGGSGLGLAMTYTIIRQHGGFIEVYSTPGVGTTFALFFPDHPAGTAPLPKALAPPLTWQTSGLVLVIDDEEIVRTVATGILAESGLTVREAAGGAEGVSKFAACAADCRLVLLDMSMPDLSGLEVFPRLKSLRADIPVLIASGFGQDPRISRVLALGAAGFIEKPFTFADLTAKVRGILEPGPD
jgi:PAS domain S-box-containing protein